MYTLAIEDTVKVPVKFNANSAGKVINQFFHLECERLDQEQIDATLKDKEEKMTEFARRVTKGWSGQTIVLDANKKPAEFCVEAFDVLLGLPGMAQIIFKSYLQECGAKEKN